jgi:HEAT repeat protein
VRLARLLGRVGSAACVPLLETLARGGNRQVSAEATRNLLAIGDPRSAGLVREILRTSNAERRSAILAAIAAGEAADSAPLLVQVLSDCDALRDDHALALDLLGSLRQLGDRRALAAVARLMQRRSWLRPRRSRALRRHTIETLLALPGSSGFQTVTDVVHNGDRQLRRLARAALQRVEDAAPTGAEETT